MWAPPTTRMSRALIAESGESGKRVIHFFGFRTSALLSPLATAAECPHSDLDCQTSSFAGLLTSPSNTGNFSKRAGLPSDNRLSKLDGGPLNGALGYNLCMSATKAQVRQVSSVTSRLTSQTTETARPLLVSEEVSTHQQPQVFPSILLPWATQSRPVHTSAFRRMPGGGGYMRTGHIPQKERQPRYLVTGACGQIGMELVPYLRERLGVENVVASDIKTSSREYLESGPFVYADVQDYEGLARLVLENGIDVIVHLASLLSAIGEKNPQLALKINTLGIQNVLELARQHQLKVYAPSSIAVFGPTTPKDNTPDVTIMEPTTMYGITKVHLELLGNYYNRVYGVDFRSLRYPGVISAKTKPGGGTTDYAVEIYHEALTRGAYHCFLDANQLLPMMYMPDCLKATYDLIHAPRPNLTQNVYNVTAMSFTPQELAAAIKGHMPEFEMIVGADFRQDIASTWPRTIDDSRARRDWKWQPDYDIEGMTEDMLSQLRGLYEPMAQQQSLEKIPASFGGNA